jgi:transketolase
LTATLRPLPAPAPHAGRFQDLESMALRVREQVLRLAGRGGCFAGAALSCVDILVYLYARVLRASAERPHDPARDYLLLSKGHAVPALYATLVEFGFLERRRLRAHLRTEDVIYWHPNRGVPGVEFHSGSLGHLLAIGLGVALDIRLRGDAGRVFVVMGDGELNEGSVWEALLVAAALRLDNLFAIVDRNELQANARTEELVPLEPLAAKLEAFGWACRKVDGHDFAALDAGLARLPVAAGRPSALIARTVRGRGVPELENRVDRWFVKAGPDEVEALVRQLRVGAAR